jgi:hypothetical protein
MDLGGSARTKRSGSPWLAVALILAVAVAAMGAVWFASSAGLATGTPKPETVTYVNRYGLPNAVDRSYDQIEAQRLTFAPPYNQSVSGGGTPGAHRRVAPSGSDRIEHLRKAGAPVSRDRVGGP